MKWVASVRERARRGGGRLGDGEGTAEFGQRPNADGAVRPTGKITKRTHGGWGAAGRRDSIGASHKDNTGIAGDLDKWLTHLGMMRFGRRELPWPWATTGHEKGGDSRKARAKTNWLADGRKTTKRTQRAAGALRGASAAA
jgi:hypothetical protein